MQELFGLSCALATPFDQNGAVDEDLMIEHARTCMQRGCRSVTLFGTTGEGASLGETARKNVLSAFSRSGIDMRTQVITCIASNAMDDAATLCRNSLDLDCRGLLLCPPHYFKGLSDDGLFDWFSGVFSRLGSTARDVFLYHIPSVTGVSISPSVVSRLRERFPGVVAGIKDSSGSRDTAMKFLSSHGDIAVLIGDERLLADAMRHGAQGAISGLANIVPEKMAAIVANGEEAPGIHELTDAVLQNPVVPAVKHLIGRRWQNPAWPRVRAPLNALSSAAAQVLDVTFDRHFSGLDDAADAR